MTVSLPQTMSVLADADAARVTVSGDVDLANADQLKSLGLEAIESTRHTVVVELSAVTFIDSTGLGALIAIRNEAQRAGRDLLLHRPSLRVMKALEITGLTKVFTIAA